MNNRVPISLAALGVTVVLGSTPTITYAAETAASTAAANTAEKCSPELEARNKEIVAKLTLDPAELQKLLSPEYVQHNPDIVRFAELNGLDYYSATKMMGNFIRDGRKLDARPANQPPPNMLYKLIAECDTVVAISQIWKPRPDDATKFYAFYFFNTWRLKDGKLIEHWDPDQMPDTLPEYLKVPFKDLKPAANTSK